MLVFKGFTNIQAGVREAIATLTLQHLHLLPHGHQAAPPYEGQGDAMKGNMPAVCHSDSESASQTLYISVFKSTVTKGAAAQHYDVTCASKTAAHWRLRGRASCLSWQDGRERRSKRQLFVLIARLLKWRTHTRYPMFVSGTDTTTTNIGMNFCVKRLAVRTYEIPVIRKQNNLKKPKKHKSLILITYKHLEG